MGSTTPNLGLYKPDVGETGWGGLVDQNWDALDSLSLSGGVYPQTALTAFVDYANGSDSNNGRSPSSAYKTVQFAYNALKTYTEAHYSDAGKGLGVGTIQLLPGRHDVAAGLSFASNRPVKLVGNRMGAVTHFPSNSAAILVSSSSSITEMVLLSHASAIGYGFQFQDVAFFVDQATNTSLTKVIYAKKIGDLDVDRCSFCTFDNNTNLSVTSVFHEDITTPSGEAGWVRVTNNNVSRLQLYKSSTGGSGGNFNRGLISNNVVFYGGSLPMIHFNADLKGYLVAGNNLEGLATAVELGSTGAFTQCTFVNNSGEDQSTGTPTNPFYKLSGSVSQMLILGGTCITPQASGYGVWVSFGANAYRNCVIGVFDLVNTTTLYKRLITETSHADKNLLIPLNLAMPAYTVTNPTSDRALNVTVDTTAQVAAVLGTLIADLQARGIVK